MISKYFLFAFVCVALTQVQGDEVVNTVRKGLLKVESLYNRGVGRINGIGYQSETIPTKANVFITRIQRTQESSRQNLRTAAQTAAEKAKELNRPESVFNCISEAEKRANDQIQTLTTRLRADIENLAKSSESRIQLAAKPLPAKKEEFTARYERTVEQIKACKTYRCVELAVNNYSVYVEGFYGTITNIQNQISTILSNFQREARAVYTTVDREIGGVQAVGLREIRGCVYERSQ